MSSDPPADGAFGTDPTPAPTPDQLARRALARVVQKLKNGSRVEAVRLFLQAADHEALPKNLRLKSWVRQRIGEEAMRQLISAMASYPCFGCQEGSEPCIRCDGSGFVAFMKVCPACIGFGSARCDFCNGSGLATYNLLPASFRTAVIARRASRAIKVLEKLAEESSAGAQPAISQPNPLQHLHNLNRVMGVLENAVVQARQMAESGPLTDESVHRLVSSCTEAARKAHDPIVVVLQRLAQSQRDAAATLQGEPAQAANAKADYLEALASSRQFEQTPLQHSFLDPRPTSDVPDLAPAADDVESPPAGAAADER